MRQNDNSFPLQSTSTARDSTANIYSAAKSRTSLVRVQTHKLRIAPDRDDLSRFRRDASYSGFRTDLSLHSRSRERDRDHDGVKLLKKTGSPGQEVFSTPDFVVSDCWKTTSGEMPVKLIQLFKDNCLEAEDSDTPVRKRKLFPEEDNEMLSYTREFHVLNEVQKERILTVVEDTLKKLAHRDMKDYSEGFFERPPRTSVTALEQLGREKVLCKKFLLPWVIVKVLEMVLCHVTQLIFLSGDTYFHRRGDFTPVVVTYYLTVFIVIFSLFVHVCCFCCSGTLNPCYFMGAVSSSILTLITSLGILIMLIMMEYYTSFQEIAVLAFVGIFLCSLLAELCLCYKEVKNLWSTSTQTELYYGE